MIAPHRWNCMMIALSLTLCAASPALADDAAAGEDAAASIDPYAVQTAPTTQPASTQPTTQPTTQPVLPQGHPALPGGHPALPQGHPALPAGHPPLPDGHPPVGAATQPATIEATLVIRAVQKTAKGPAIGNEEATIRLLVRGRPVDTIKTKLDGHGVAMIEQRVVPSGSVPLVTVTHAGVEHQMAGKPLTVQTAEQIITIPVYETTEKQPPWRVRMWHVMVQPSDHGVRVSQLLAVQNPADRTWLGDKDEHGHRTTLVLPMSPNAMNVELGRGFQKRRATVIGGRAVDSMPLLPGTWRYEMKYGVPVADGRAAIDFEVPAAADQIVVYMIDGQATVKVTGLDDGTVIAGRDKQEYRMYQASKVKAGARITIELSDLALPDTATKTAGHSSLPKVLAGGGVAVVVLAAVGMLVLSPMRKNRSNKLAGPTDDGRTEPPPA